LYIGNDENLFMLQSFHPCCWEQVG
jgi:hypothetical protein